MNGSSQRARIFTGVESICCVKDGQRSKLLKDNNLNKIQSAVNYKYVGDL